MITAGDDNNDFTIMTNGSIVTKHALDRETIPMYSLTITARDCASEPEKRLSSTVQVSGRINMFHFYLTKVLRVKIVVIRRPWAKLASKQPQNFRLTIIGVLILIWLLEYVFFSYLFLLLLLLMVRLRYI